MKKTTLFITAVALAISFAACNREEEPTPQPQPGVDEETYAGGLLGTTFNQSVSIVLVSNIIGTVTNINNSNENLIELYIKFSILLISSEA